MVGKPVSPQKLPPAFKCVQVSFVYLTSKFIFLVMLTSPRILSWRGLIVSSNDQTQLVVPPVLGSGNTFKIAKPPRLLCFSGILFPCKASKNVLPPLLPP